MVAVRRTRGLTEDLGRLAAALESLDLRGAGVLDDPVAGTRDRLVRTIRSYLIPRLEAPDSPLLVVFAGPTGSGKSTLVNSLAGLDVSAAGPVRPTTAVPLALASQVEIGRITDDGECRVVVGGAPILQHMTLVDTPDIDSTSSGHRVIAERLVDQADIVVFVTSALRYADEVPWEVLRRAQSRGATIIPVINRVGAGSTAVLPDFRGRLVAAGIDSSMVRLPEHHLGPGAQRVPSLAVGELRRRLYEVVRDRKAHQAQVVNRVINNLFDQVTVLDARVREIDRTLQTTAEEMRAAMAATAKLPAMVRPYASLILAPLPRRGLRRWKRRSQQGAAGLARWEETVKAGLVAELESTMRQAVSIHGGAVILLGESLSTLTSDAGRMLREAVDGWVDEIHLLAEGDTHPRLTEMTLIAAVLTPVDEVVTSAVLGDGHPALVAAAEDALRSRVEEVHNHFGETVAEAWRLVAGQPDPGDLGPRLSAVITAYQFADA